MFNFDWLAGVPIESAKILFIASFIGLGLWVMRLPRSYVMEGAVEAPWWRDLRLWTLAILGILSGIYWYF